MWHELILYPAGNLEKTVYTDPAFGGFGDFIDTFRDRIGTFLRQVSDELHPKTLTARAKRVLPRKKSSPQPLNRSTPKPLFT